MVKRWKSKGVSSSALLTILGVSFCICQKKGMCLLDQNHVDKPFFLTDEAKTDFSFLQRPLLSYSLSLPASMKSFSQA